MVYFIIFMLVDSFDNDFMHVFSYYVDLSYIFLIARV